MQKIVVLMAFSSKTEPTTPRQLRQRRGRRPYHKSLQYSLSDKLKKKKNLTEFQFVFNQPICLKMTKCQKWTELILPTAHLRQITVHPTRDGAAIPPLYVLNSGTPEGETWCLLWPGLEETVHPTGLRARRNFFEEEILLEASHLQNINVRADTTPR